MESLTKNRVKAVSRVVGVFCFILPGILVDNVGVLYLVLFSVGFACLMITLRFRSGTDGAMELLLTTNICFWCSVGLWRFAPFSLDFGEPLLVDDTFEMVLAIWFAAFIFASFYELVEFLWAIFTKSSRRLAVIGLIGVAVQLLATMRFIFSTARSLA